MMPIDGLYLAYFGYIDVKVRDVPRIGCKFRRVSRDTVVKSWYGRNHEVANLSRIIGKCSAVHDKHMQ